MSAYVCHGNPSEPHTVDCPNRNAYAVKVQPIGAVARFWLREGASLQWAAERGVRPWLTTKRNRAALWATREEARAAIPILADMGYLAEVVPLIAGPGRHV